MTSNESPPSLPRPRTSRIPLLAIGAVVLIGAGAGLYLFFAGDEPEAVSLEAAVAAATSTSAATDTTGAATTTSSAPETTVAEETTTTATAETEGIDGTWVVDTSIGTFDFESATGSFVGFRIRETLGQGIGETEAVGRTGDVSGTLAIAGTEVTSVDVEADLSTLTSNQSRRDDRVQDALNTGEFPTATFTLTEPIELPAGAADGEAVAGVANGDLTVSGVTQPVAFDVQAQLVDGIIVVVASTEITFADYGVAVPSAGIVLSVDDFGIVEMQLLFTRQ